MGKRLTKLISFFCAIVIIVSTGGVFAAWKYAANPMQNQKIEIFVEMQEFVYIQELPKEERAFLERIGDLLNNDYHNSNIPEGQSLQFLLSTLDKNWETGHNPAMGSFVGSMDPTPESQDRIEAMFGDIIDFSDPNHVSFILKSEDLVGSVENEIAIYSTLDPLTYTPGDFNRVVGVYLSVFVPVVDDQGVVVGYEMLCESVHGYCMEVPYTDGSNTPSFSTDHWRDELFYWHEDYGDPLPIVGDDRYNYECYHSASGYYAYLGRTEDWHGWVIVQTNQWEIGEYTGNRAWQKLQEILGA